MRGSCIYGALITQPHCLPVKCAEKCSDVRQAAECMQMVRAMQDSSDFRRFAYKHRICFHFLCLYVISAGYLNNV